MLDYMIVLFNILREYTFRHKIVCQDLYLSKFYPYIDHLDYIPPREDLHNLSKDWINVNSDLKKSIEECKLEHDLTIA